MKRLAFMGSDPIGLPLLQWLHVHSGEQFQLVGTISGADRPAGRGHRLRTNPIVEECHRIGIETFQSAAPNREARNWLLERAIDGVIVFAYGHILSDGLLQSVPLGFLNLHGSILPALRGPSPIERTIQDRLSTAGLSLMQMVRAMDAGPIYGSMAVTLRGDEMAPDLRRRIADLAPILMERYLYAILARRLTPTPQDETRATYCHLIKKEDGHLDFCRPAAALEAQIRALISWPGSYFMVNGSPVKVGAAEVNEGSAGEAPGMILGLHRGALEIATGQGILRCIQLQWPTRKMLPAPIFWQAFGKSFPRVCRSVRRPDAPEN